jgi:hypothetical protein
MCSSNIKSDDSAHPRSAAELAPACGCRSKCAVWGAHCQASAASSASSSVATASAASADSHASRHSSCCTSRRKPSAPVCFASVLNARQLQVQVQKQMYVQVPRSAGTLTMCCLVTSQLLPHLKQQLQAAAERPRRDQGAVRVLLCGRRDPSHLQQPSTPPNGLRHIPATCCHRARSPGAR